jgi:hypothetical protein
VTLVDPRFRSEVFVPVNDPTHVTNWVSIASAVAAILSSTLAIVGWRGSYERELQKTKHSATSE